MKLIDHILKEHRTVHIYKDKKRFILRIIPREHPIARMRGCSKAFYMDVWNTYYIQRSRRYGVAMQVTDLTREFDTVEEALNFVKEKGFSIRHPRKLPKGLSFG